MISDMVVHAFNYNSGETHNSTSEESYSEDSVSEDDFKDESSSEEESTSEGKYLFSFWFYDSENWEESSSHDSPIMSEIVYDSLKSKLVFSGASANINITQAEANELKKLMKKDQNKKL